MNERLKKLAEQAGLEELGDGDWCSLNHPDVRAEHLERFAELVRDDERELCAKLCDDEAGQSSSDHEAGGMYWCAAAIRERGEK